MKALRVTIITLVLLSVAISGQAQETQASQEKTKASPKKEKRFWDNASIGGYLGAQFGSVTNVNLSPLLIYRVRPSFYTGLGFTYLYYKDRRYTPSYTSHGYGGSVFLRYHVWRDIFVQVEYDPLNYTFYSDYDIFGKYVGWHKENVWVHDLLLGAGYRQWLGGRAFATLAVFWNINETPYSPESNPIIRIGFGVGL